MLSVITIEEFSTEPTNQSITVTATTSKGTLNQESHTFTENGLFEFVATDAAGNITKETVSVDNINKVLPVITVADYIKSPTNENITVTVSADKGTFNQDSYTFEKNESFEFVVTDIYGNIAKETVKITNIDKVAPVVTLTPSETNPTNKNVTITVEATDNLSGIAEIELHDKSVVKVDKATFVAEENGAYSFKVTDKAGNITSKEITVSNLKGEATLPFLCEEFA